MEPAAPGPGPVFAIVAGEPSSDHLAAGLIRELGAHWPQARFIGVTGPAMRAAGCKSLADINELSLFGIGEVVVELPRLLRLRRRLSRDIVEAQPCCFVGVDAPAFNLGLAERLKKRGIKTAQYVCPTAWAWRQGRTRQIRRSIDLLLAIFPFEPAFFARFGIQARFIGHPLVDRRQGDGHDLASARAELGLQQDATVLALLPGSRSGEVARLGPNFLAATEQLVAAGKVTEVVVPVAHADLTDQLTRLIAQVAPSLQVRLTHAGAYQTLQAADVALVASGTVTLEALIADTPMVVAYRLSAFNALIARLFRLIRTPVVSMPNLLANETVVPEYIQAQAGPQNLSGALARLLDDEAERTAQRDAFAAIRSQLTGDTDRRAATAVADLVEGRQ